MMPVSLLIALVLAFGMEPSRFGRPAADVGRRVLETCGGIGLVAALAFGLGAAVAARVARTGLPSSRLRRWYLIAARLLTVVALAVYGWILHGVGWSLLVRANWGLDGWPILNDLAVFLPFGLIQVFLWCGLFFAERALQFRMGLGAPDHLGRYLVARARQSLGLILPVVLLYVVRRDVIARFWPRWDENPWAEPLELTVLGTLVLLASPVFVRLAWPTRPLPNGELRRRLEQVARRVGFRFTDVLVWDTGHTMHNACVTGILPGFRYVLLTDALIDTMSPLETAAVFGHEIGHVVHRHLLFFGLFFAGSLGVLALLADGIAAVEPWASRALGLAGLLPPNITSEVVQSAALLALAGVYFWLVFGHLSRRFERQADVFGGKAVSCGLAVCPPRQPWGPEDAGPSSHADLGPAPISGPGPRAATLAVRPRSHADARAADLALCPEGVRVFAEALANVALWNGMEPARRSWRHGSIAARIAFLESLEKSPEGERAFQREMWRLRAVLAVLLALAAFAGACHPFG